MIFGIFSGLGINVCRLCNSTWTNILQQIQVHSVFIWNVHLFCNTLQHAATRCNTLQHNNYMHRRWRKCCALWIRHKRRCRDCTTLLHTATHCNTLQHAATLWLHASPTTHQRRCRDCNTLQHTATRCNTMITCIADGLDFENVVLCG